jgi:hypothetical protein
MDDREAHKIISALADGCDPTTGEKVGGSVLQHGDVIRALHIAVRALGTRARLKARRSRVPANAGKPWTEEEDLELLESFDQGKSVAELAKAHERTPAGIHARLVRHGRLDESGPQSRGRAATAAVGPIRSERSES